jgi:hypothetical protein
LRFPADGLARASFNPAGRGRTWLTLWLERVQRQSEKLWRAIPFAGAGGLSSARAEKLIGPWGTGFPVAALRQPDSDEGARRQDKKRHATEQPGAAGPKVRRVYLPAIIGDRWKAISFLDQQFMAKP